MNTIDFAQKCSFLPIIKVAFESINLPRMAEAEYKAAIKAEPERPEIHAHYADLLYRTGDIAGAVLQLEIAIALCKDVDDETKSIFLPGKKVLIVK